MSLERIILIIATIFISVELALLSLSLYLFTNLSNNPDVNLSSVQPQNQVIKNL